MEKIIAQITVKVVEKILKNIEENGISEVGKTAESFWSILKEGALELLSVAIEEVDAALLRAKKERRVFCKAVQRFRSYENSYGYA